MRFTTSVLLTLLLVLSLSINSNAFEPQFNTRIEYGFATSLGFMLGAADYDADGDIDLAVVVGVSIVLMVNTGDGLFESVRLFDNIGMRNAISLRSTDLDLDGDVDLIVVGSLESGDLEQVGMVFLNDGTGGFLHQSTVAFPLNPLTFGFSDISGDGYPEILGASDTTFTMLMNNGDGSYGSEIVFPGLEQAYDFFGADFDNDGDRDLVLLHDMNDSVRILYNNGDGTFADPVHYFAGYRALLGTAGDLNNDGFPDLVINAGVNDSIQILMNLGDGTFSAPVSYEGTDYPLEIILADLNGDSYQDIALLGHEDNDIGVLHNNGDGTFGPTQHFDGPFEPFGLVAADLDGDGDLDLATVGRYALAIHQNLGDGSFVILDKVNPLDHKISGTYSNLLATTTGDLDGDGNQDIITAAEDPNQVMIAMGNGDGSFEPTVVYPVGSNPESVNYANLNSDNHLDLFTANRMSNSVSLLMGNGDGTFEPAISLPVGNGPNCAVSKDFNGDGFADIIVTNKPAGTFQMYFGAGDGSFTLNQTTPIGTLPTWVDAADLDNDGDIDVSITYEDSYLVTVLLNNGSGVLFQGGNYNLPSYKSPLEVERARTRSKVLCLDLNGDGYKDLAVARSLVDPVYLFDTQSLHILINNGDGTFYVSGTYGTYNKPTSICGDDFDLDGDIDLVVGNYNSNNVSLFTNLGDGQFSPAVHYGVYMAPLGLSSADFDNDGFPDLAVASDTYSHNLPHATSILWNTGSTSPTLFCCGEYVGGRTGNIDCSPDGSRNLADITLLIDRIYITRTNLCCEKNGNVDGDSWDRKNLSDITELIDHVYLSKLETSVCQ